MIWATYDTPKVSNHVQVIREDLSRLDLAQFIKLLRANPNSSPRFLVELIYLHQLMDESYLAPEILSKYDLQRPNALCNDEEDIKTSLMSTEDLLQYALDKFNTSN
jgi:hypothetical protein